MPMPAATGGAAAAAAEEPGAAFREAGAWQGPGRPARTREFRWRSLLWWLILPERRYRTTATLPGLALFGLAGGIGMAAYNTGSNILFLTLSLLLACLLLSGLLSWANFSGLRWRLRPSGPWRAGRETLVTVEIANDKRRLPTYGIWFDFVLHPRRSVILPDDPDPNARQILAHYRKALARGRAHLRERLEPAGQAELDWAVKPERRGEAVLELASVGSFFPFGFLNKAVLVGVKQKVRIWPARVDYQWRGVTSAPGENTGRRSSRLGGGEDLLALRLYREGDSHRLIHWKASARLGKLMIRQFAAENDGGYSVLLDAAAERWPRPEQFELFCGFAASLLEDLFASGRLRGVGWRHGGWHDTRQVRDLEAFLDELAVVDPVSSATTGTAVPRGGIPANPANLITFAPEGARGVTAYVDGIPTASA